MTVSCPCCAKEWCIRTAPIETGHYRTSFFFSADNFWMHSRLSCFWSEPRHAYANIMQVILCIPIMRFMLWRALIHPAANFVVQGLALPHASPLFFLSACSRGAPYPSVLYMQDFFCLFSSHVTIKRKWLAGCQHKHRKPRLRYQETKCAAALWCSMTVRSPGQWQAYTTSRPREFWKTADVSFHRY